MPDRKLLHVLATLVAGAGVITLKLVDDCGRSARALSHLAEPAGVVGRVGDDPLRAASRSADAIGGAGLPASRASGALGAAEAAGRAPTLDELSEALLDGAGDLALELVASDWGSPAPHVVKDRLQTRCPTVTDVVAEPEAFDAALGGFGIACQPLVFVAPIAAAAAAAAAADADPAAASGGLPAAAVDVPARALQIELGAAVTTLEAAARACGAAGGRCAFVAYDGPLPAAARAQLVQQLQRRRVAPQLASELAGLPARAFAADPRVRAVALMLPQGELLLAEPARAPESAAPEAPVAP